MISKQPHDDLREVLAPWALGVLTATEAAAVEHHLHECGACASLAGELIRTSDVLWNAEPVVSAPEDLRHLVLAAVRRDAAPRRGTRWIARVRSWRPRPRLALVAVPVVTLLCVCAGLVGALRDRTAELDTMRTQLVSLSGRPDLPVLKGASIRSFDVDAPFNDARAQVALQDDAGVVVMRNVPAPPEGTVWQVWQVDRDDHIVSLAVIDGARQSLFLPLEDIDRDELERIIITSEPGVGSEVPAEDSVVAESGV